MSYTRQITMAGKRKLMAIQDLDDYVKRDTRLENLYTRISEHHVECDCNPCRIAVARWLVILYHDEAAARRRRDPNLSWRKVTRWWTPSRFRGRMLLDDACYDLVLVIRVQMYCYLPKELHGVVVAYCSPLSLQDAFALCPNPWKSVNDLLDMSKCHGRDPLIVLRYLVDYTMSQQ